MALPPTGASGGRRVKALIIAFWAIVASQKRNRPLEGSDFHFPMDLSN